MSVCLWMREPGKWITARVQQMSPRQDGRFAINITSFKSREIADLVVAALRDTMNRGGIASVETAKALITALQKEQTARIAKGE